MRAERSEAPLNIAVIGGGIAGASVAYELSARAEVALFEQEPICGYHSTGRSAALFTECYGDPVVRRLAIASRPFLAAPPPGFSDSPLVTPRSLLFVGTADQAPALATALEEFRAMVPTVKGVGGEEARALCPVLDPEVVAGGILEPGAMDIDVHALHLGYQQAARTRGARILTRSPVVNLRLNGGSWTVATPDGNHEADIVVNAAGAWADVVGGMAGTHPIGLVPKRRTAFTFRPPDGFDHRRWPMVIDVDEHWYFRPEGAHLLASPADETAMHPCDARHEEADVALAIERITAVTTMPIRSIERAWAGLRSFVADHRPVNGWDPEVPGFYWLAAQGGFGIKTAPAMARFAEGTILDGAPPADLTRAGLSAGALSPARLATEAEST
ncbi:MAG: FAD-binding oxidoreductase [Acidimicrobiia bacterium]